MQSESFTAEGWQLFKRRIDGAFWAQYCDAAERENADASPLWQTIKHRGTGRCDRRVRYFGR